MGGRKFSLFLYLSASYVYNDFIRESYTSWLTSAVVAVCNFSETIRYKSVSVQRLNAVQATKKQTS